MTNASGTGAYLGHRRLAIIDLDHGAQPMRDRDKSVAVVFNGEIYNHVDLRRELEVPWTRLSERPQRYRGPDPRLEAMGP